MFQSTKAKQKRPLLSAPLLVVPLGLLYLLGLASTEATGAEPNSAGVYQVANLSNSDITWHQPSSYSEQTTATEAAPVSAPPQVAFNGPVYPRIEHSLPMDAVFAETPTAAPVTPLQSFDYQPVSMAPASHPIAAHQYIEPVDHTSVTNPQFHDPERVFAPACNATCCQRAPLSFKEDACNFLPMLWDDTCSVVNRENLIVLGVALGGAIAIRQDWDGEVREYTARHPKRWGQGSEFLGKMAEPQIQIPVMFGIYGWSLYHQDEELHEFSKALISAYTVTSLSTLAIKGIANTDRPSDDWNDGQYGFPSYHTSSSFAMAAVVEEYYGWKAGAPAYAVAGLIGWSRLDERDHDLSDVLFGAALGCVIGKAIAQHHLDKYEHATCYPYIDPVQGSTGIMFDCQF